MIAKELISEVVPVMRNSDTGIKALNWMEIFRVSHLPIVSENKFVGLISDSDIYDNNMSDSKLEDHRLSLFQPYVTENQHIYEVVELISRLKLTVVPVLDDNKNYLGVINIHDLVKEFANITGSQMPGAVLVLAMNIKDYSISEIANIIEANDTKILSLYLATSQDTSDITLTIKLNTRETSSIKQSLERYGYNISASYTENDKMNILLEERYEEFMRYLDF